MCVAVEQKARRIAGQQLLDLEEKLRNADEKARLASEEARYKDEEIKRLKELLRKNGISPTL